MDAVLSAGGNWSPPARGCVARPLRRVADAAAGRATSLGKILFQGTAAIDKPIVECVREIARGGVAAPIVGVTKLQHP